MTHGKLLIGFGVFLVVCGVLGWGATGFSERGKTAIMSGSMSGMIMLACGLAATLKPSLAVAARWTGLVFAVMFAGVFSWRATVAWLAVGAGEPKLLVGLLLSTMALAAWGVAGRLALVRETRPEPQRGFDVAASI